MDMLELHLEEAFRADIYFRDYWTNLKDKKAFFKLARNIDRCVLGDIQTVKLLHTEAHDLTKRIFSRVQEREFVYSSIPKGWSSVVREPAKRQREFERAMAVLRVLKTRSKHFEKTQLYGNTKSTESLDRKRLSSLSGNGLDRNVPDTWDAIRFRFVFGNIQCLLEAATLFWEYFFDRILRCRNFYYYPKGGNVNDPYRAIHFQVQLTPGSMAEVQMLTNSKEIAGLLDYSYVFKRVAEYRNQEHEMWLQAFRMKANILDITKFRRSRAGRRATKRLNIDCRLEAISSLDPAS